MLCIGGGSFILFLMKKSQAGLEYIMISGFLLLFLIITLVSLYSLRILDFEKNIPYQITGLSTFHTEDISLDESVFLE